MCHEQVIDIMRRSRFYSKRATRYTDATIHHLLVCFSCWKTSGENDDDESQYQHRDKQVGAYRSSLLVLAL